MRPMRKRMFAADAALSGRMRHALLLALSAVLAGDWKRCLADLAAAERAFFDGARCDRRFTVRVEVSSNSRVLTDFCVNKNQCRFFLFFFRAHQCRYSRARVRIVWHSSDRRKARFEHKNRSAWTGPRISRGCAAPPTRCGGRRRARRRSASARRRPAGRSRRSASSRSGSSLS